MIFLAHALKAIMKASGNDIASASKNPHTVSRVVTQALAANSGAHLMAEAAMADGAGRSHAGTLKASTTSSHTITAATYTSGVTERFMMAVSALIVPNARR